MNAQLLLKDVDCKYGAPMGRPTISTNPEAAVHLFKVRMGTVTPYDRGGAYWGIGHNPLYACIGEGFQTFTRAPDRATAKRQIQEKFPNLKFKR